MRLLNSLSKLSAGQLTGLEQGLNNEISQVTYELTLQISGLEQGLNNEIT